MRKRSDWLHNRSEKRRETGLSVLDLATLPPNHRKIMRLLLRNVEMTYSELCEAVEAMPESDRVDRSELDKILEALSKQGWLIRVSDQCTTYKVNLRRKAGSQLPQSIWAALDPKTQQSRTSEESSTEDPER